MNNKQPKKSTPEQSNTARHIIDVATKLMQDGAPVAIAVTAANALQSHPELIERINVLKEIEMLDATTQAFLYSIELTDNVLQIEPKINAIWALIKAAGLIDDMPKFKVDIPDTVGKDDDIQQIAADVLDELLIT